MIKGDFINIPGCIYKANNLPGPHNITKFATFTKHKLLKKKTFRSYGRVISEINTLKINESLNVKYEFNLQFVCHVH